MTAQGSVGAAATTVAAAAENSADPEHLLEQLEALVRGSAPAGEGVEAVLAAARRRANRLLAEDRSLQAVVLRRFLADVVNDLWLEARWEPAAVRALLGRAAEISGVSASELALEVLDHAALLRIPPSVAVETVLQMLLALIGARHVSLWRSDAGGRVKRHAAAGSQRSPAGARALAEQVLEGAVPPSAAAARLISEPVLRWQQPQAVLIAQPAPGHAQPGRALFACAAEMLAAVIERQMVLMGGARAQQAIMAATDRRLARLGLDLHDGPLQALVRTVHQIEDCRRMLEEAVADERERKRVRGWLDDLEARLLEMEDELRDYSASLGTRRLLRRPVPDMLRDLVEEFRAQSPARIRLQMTGEFDGMTQSQQIALVRIVQEALNNARAHSGAGDVLVSVAATPESVRARITDDGCGFDVEQTLVRAARNGRLGLLGMDERVRLLGGTFRIRSEVGAFTEVSLTLPRWAAEAAADEFWRMP